MSEYTEQAEKFLIDTGTKMETTFLYHGPYFPDEKENRDVYEIKLTRALAIGTKSWSFKFGQSIQNSLPKPDGRPSQTGLRIMAGTRIRPTAYDALTAITKSDPGTFKDFCGDFGYDEDSRRAERTYIAVVEEWKNVERMFGDVLERLQEIQ
jgi:hypothetical protein